MTEFEQIEDLLIEFDEMGFLPATTVPDSEGFAVRWKNRLIDAIKDYSKASDVARAIFEDIEENYADYIFDGSRNIIVITEKDFAELKKKYTEGEK